MAVDLGELVDGLKREVSPPGQYNALFPDSTDDILLGYLQDAFWEARNEGLNAFLAWTELDGIVTPVNGTTDLSKDLQQVLVFFAGYRILINAIRNLQSEFHAKAGPVELTTQISATTLTAIMNALKEKRNLLLLRLSDVGSLPSYYVDMLLARDDAINMGDSWWER